MIRPEEIAKAWEILGAIDLVCLIGFMEAHKLKSDWATIYLFIAMVVSLIGSLGIAGGNQP